MGKRKSYYHKAGQSQAEKKAKLKFGEASNKLDVNMKGFLITYNCKFTFCLNEAKKLLQQFSLPSDNVSAKEEEEKKKENVSDLDKELQEELDSLNKRDKELAVLDTGAKYTIFIHLDSVSSNSVVEAIFEYMKTNKKPLGRYVQRLLPIANTCKAHLEDIEKCMRKTLDELEPIKQSSAELKDDAKPFKYCCIFKTSNNGSLKREDAFRMVGNYFQTKNPANKVDFDAPEYVLILNIICNMCFVSFVKNYFEYKKYNFIEYAAQFTANSDKNKAPKSSQPPRHELNVVSQVKEEETTEPESSKSMPPEEPKQSDTFSLMKGFEVSSIENETVKAE